jgi:hypothetical protein
MHNSRCQVFFTNNHIRYYETPVNALILLRIGGSNVDGFCASVVGENTQPTADTVRHSTANDCEQRNTNKDKKGLYTLQKNKRSCCERQLLVFYKSSLEILLTYITMRLTESL